MHRTNGDTIDAGIDASRRARAVSPIDELDVNDLVASMTIAEKAGQMTQVEFGSITPDEVAAWAVGSILSGGGGNPGDGSASAWRDNVDTFVTASRRSRL